MSLSDLKGSSSKGKGDAKKEGRGGGNAERVLSAYEVASKGISLKLHPRISQQTQEGHIGWYMGRAGEGIDAVYSSTDKRLSEDGKLCKVSRFSSSPIFSFPFLSFPPFTLRIPC